MGWCHEFGCQITSGCNHPMKAGASACTCTMCETVCRGKFSGCPEIFALQTVSHIVHVQADAPAFIGWLQPLVIWPVSYTHLTLPTTERV